MARGTRTKLTKKMTQGALIFAFDNEQTDYVRMAAWSAERIHRYLDIPVAVVTDAPDRARAYSGIDRVIASVPDAGGTRWFEDYQSTVTWHNAGRVDAYALSPWDRTLVLDADYVVCSDRLNQLWGHSNFLCHRLAWDITTGDVMNGLNQFGQYNQPMYWATVMMFERCNTAQYVFDAMHMIRNNWQHYRDLYHIHRSTYRNDFALSIALGIVSGHTGVVDTIPWDLASCLPGVELECWDRDIWVANYKNAQGKPHNVTLWGQDFHAMNKQQLEKIIAAS